MIGLVAAEFLVAAAEKKYEVLRDGRLNIVGYRNPLGRPNYFDDIISVYSEEGYGWEERHYAATTLPGLPSLLKPVNKNGTAILVSGQYIDSYSLGLHRGKYKALVQVRTVKVYRDNNLDSVYDTKYNFIQTGLFGINIHRASLGAKIVGPDSAGCQVVYNRSDYDEFISICESVSMMHGNKFTYTLVDV